MIWYFLGGMVAGAVGIVMLAKWFLSAKVVRVSREEMLRDLGEDKEKTEEKTHE